MELVVRRRSLSRYGKMRGWAGVVGLVGVWTIVACSLQTDGQDGARNAGWLQIGETCRYEDPEECASGLCMDNSGRGSPHAICSQACTSDADCSGGLPVCGSDVEGRRVCVYRCPSESHPGFTCETGQPVACGNDVTLCQECGCGKSERCEVGVGCVSTVGDPCVTSDDCDGGLCLARKTDGAGVCYALCSGFGDATCPTRCVETSTINGAMYCDFLPS